MTTPQSGFLLKYLALEGPSVKRTEIEFCQGLNVVSGPSDTGKTFIFQCINFMLGASSPPKEIPESKGYESVQLCLEANDDELILERSLEGGAFRLLQGEETQILGEKHAAGNHKTVSHLLLTLTDLVDKQVCTNARGKTRPLSFRDIARLILVDEGDIIAERSPILSGQFTNKTVETSVFRLILTGLDDSSLVEQEETKITKGKQLGKKELLAELLQKNEQEIQEVELKKDATPEQIAQLLEQAEEEVVTIASNLDVEQTSISKLEDKRKTTWSNLRKIESKVAVAQELQKRFELLQEQYHSDLRRLEAIGEAGVRLAQMNEERCPICGADAQHHEHSTTQTEPKDISSACDAEVRKLQLLLKDLSATITNNKSELEELNNKAQEHQALLEESQETLRSSLKPQVASLIRQLQEAERHRNKLARLVELYSWQEELTQMFDLVEEPIPRATKQKLAVVGESEGSEFSDAAKELLLEWNFPALSQVSFSEDDQDLIINERKRSSHGKGVRALTHAAFSLALMLYCRRSARPHPGLVVLDSPLVVYREPDPSEGEEYRVKDSFYRAVDALFTTEQVIVIENEEPPRNLQTINHISFPGLGIGFLPSVVAD